MLSDDDEIRHQQHAKKRRGRPPKDQRDDEEEEDDHESSALRKQLLDRYKDADDDEEELPERERTSNAGIITRIFVENFMCHRKFDIKLNKHLNFITGRNGSGKSAIAAAIQICLGASAKNTGRGSQLSALIREGSSGPAIVDVTLMNEGDDAYHTETYGNRITIRRKIPRTGGATYHILDAHGDVSKYLHFI